MFFIGVAHSGLACLGKALNPWSSGLLVVWSPGPLVPWSPGLLVRRSSVAALGRLRVLRKAACGTFEKLGLMQMTAFAVLKMLRVLSTTAS